jgi:hypothetical protein
LKPNSLAYFDFHSNTKIISIKSAKHKGSTFVISCGATQEFELSIHEITPKMEDHPKGKLNLKFNKMIYLFGLRLDWFNSIDWYSLNLF